MEELIVNKDDYGYAINGSDTYAAIAEGVSNGPVAITWTDGYGSALSLLFAIPRHFLSSDVNYAGLHPSVHPSAALTVAIHGRGMAAFPLTEADWAPMHPDYVADKFARTGERNITLWRITDLINGVMDKWRASRGLL